MTTVNLIDLSAILSDATGHPVDFAEANHEPAAPPVVRRVTAGVVEIGYPIHEEWPTSDFFGADRPGRISRDNEPNAAEIPGEAGAVYLVPPAGIEDLQDWLEQTTSDYLAWLDGEVYALAIERWLVSDTGTANLLDCDVHRLHASLENAMRHPVISQDYRPGPSVRL